MRADHSGVVSTGVCHPERCQFSIAASASLGLSQARRLGEPEPGRVALVRRLLRRGWIEHRIGTVHTFQGKKAEAVILMLGAGRGAEAGSRTWAGATPNLLNLAATRARRVLYVVGNWTEWQSAGVFAVAAEMLAPRSPREWLRLDQLAPAQ